MGPAQQTPTAAAPPLPHRRRNGIRLRPIIIHSIWMTFGGIILFRLATANTQHGPEAEILAIAGAVLATLPWILQLLVSAAIIVSYNLGFCDLTWLIRPSHDKGSRNRSRSSGAIAHQATLDSSDEDEEENRVQHEREEQGFQMAPIKPGSAAQYYYEGPLQLRGTEIV